MGYIQNHKMLTDKLIKFHTYLITEVLPKAHAFHVVMCHMTGFKIIVKSQSFEAFQTIACVVLHFKKPYQVEIVEFSPLLPAWHWYLIMLSSKSPVLSAFQNKQVE